MTNRFGGIKGIVLTYSFAVALSCPTRPIQVLCRLWVHVKLVHENNTLTTIENHCVSVFVQGWWSRAPMTIEQSCHSMKLHSLPPISCLTCRSLGRASQRSAMAMLRYGLLGGLVIVRTTACQGLPLIVPHSHTCLPHKLEQSLETLQGHWLVIAIQEGE